MGLFLIVKIIIILQQYTFRKADRLKSRKLIGHLFSKGKSFSAYPIKVLYDVSEETSFGLKVGVTVSSRSFKKAVQRNKVKRLLREAYRLQKLTLHNLLKEQNISLALFFIYTGKELPTYTDIYKSMEILLNRLMKSFQKS